MKKILDRKGQPTKGEIGENAVASYLEEQGYDIIGQNYHSRYGEIDIIAEQGNIIAFVEVKARGPKSKGAPAEAVTLAKQKKILQTALLYLQETQSTLQPRFDVAEVFFTSGSGTQISEIRYIADAFTQNESNS
ncbi:MAG: YraN family protein [Clostridiales bacterium]|nr:YraN family protein [Clostridiales bacterium]